MNKQDLIKLSKTLSQPVSQLLDKEKGVYAGQWTIYALVYGIRALYNSVGTLITETEYLQLASPIVDNIMSKEAVKFDAKYWGGSIDGKQFDDLEKDHLAAISIRAWALQMHSVYDDSYKTLYEMYLNALIDRYESNGYSFLRINKHNYTRFVPDNLLAISVIDHSEYAQVAEQILGKANLNYGKLLPKTVKGRKTSGSYCCLSAYYLSLFKDKSMAKAQWEVIKAKLFGKTVTLCGIREYEDQSPILSLDGDGGPIVNGLSVIGTAYAIGPARAFGDHDLAQKFIKQGERVAKVVKNTQLKDYLPVGLAVLYAMISERYEE